MGIFDSIFNRTRLIEAKSKATLTTLGNTEHAIASEERESQRINSRIRKLLHKRKELIVRLAIIFEKSREYFTKKEHFLDEVYKNDELIKDAANKNDLMRHGVLIEYRKRLRAQMDIIEDVFRKIAKSATDLISMIRGIDYTIREILDKEKRIITQTLNDAENAIRDIIGEGDIEGEWPKITEYALEQARNR